MQPFFPPRLWHRGDTSPRLLTLLPCVRPCPPQPLPLDGAPVLAAFAGQVAAAKDRARAGYIEQQVGCCATACNGGLCMAMMAEHAQGIGHRDWAAPLTFTASLLSSWGATSGAEQFGYANTVRSSSNMTAVPTSPSRLSTSSSLESWSSAGWVWHIESLAPCA